MHLAFFFLTFLFVDFALGSAIALRHGIRPKSTPYLVPTTTRSQKQRPDLSVKRSEQGCYHKPSPKIFIISMFDSEANVWYRHMTPDLKAQSFAVPGFSPLFPKAYCTSNGSVCQMTTGEGEINAAASITALWMSGCFDLSKTYFMIAGVAGVNPHVATTGSATFARYAVQFDLQFEFSESQVPSNDTSGWFPQGTYWPDENKGRDYPGWIYGTEAFEVNENLRQRAINLAARAQLNDTTAAQNYRKTYGYAPANQPPSVVACDTGTSNNYWSGSALGHAFEAYTKLLTNGSGTYCTTQQEDNATLEALMRGAMASKLDFNRIIIMRTASDFDRAPPDETEVFHLLYAEQEGFKISIENIYLAGIEIVRDVVDNWESAYDGGVEAGNYVGDLLDSLDCDIKPDIGTEGIWISS